MSLVVRWYVLVSCAGVLVLLTEVTCQTLSEYTSPLTWFELTTLVELGTHCISRWKYNYYAITTTIGSFVNIKIQNVNRKWIHCICIEYNITHNTRKWISSFFTCNATQLIEAQHLTTRFHQDNATLKRQHNLLKHNIWPQRIVVVFSSTYAMSAQLH
jgi:hypothetical protein